MTAHYIISFNEISRKVDCHDFSKKADELMLYLKMVDSEVDCDIDTLFRWIWYIEQGSYYSILTQEDYSIDVMGAIEDRLGELRDKLFACLDDFETQTKITVYFEYDYELAEVFFVLNYSDVVEYTPNAKKLLDEGIQFDLTRDILN